MKEMLQSVIMFDNKEKGLTPKQIFEDYKNTTKDEKARKMVLANIKETYSELTDDEIIQNYQLISTLAELEFLTNMASIESIIKKENNRKEIIEMYKEMIKKFENFKGDIK